ncbi:flavodoxin [Candidatus Magnetomorum sp. HK-1]|nr:flavodoxin [Candidatus Magnetomorum sp. HK-1]
MKSIVVYSSQTGNTKKLAETIYENLTDDKAICKIEDAPDPSDFDIVCLGFWLMAGKPDPKSQEYLKKITNQKLFLFATHGASSQSQHAQQALETARTMASQANIIGSFNCPGEVNPKVIKKASSKPEPPVWLKDAPNAEGHPDSKDLEQLTQTLKQCFA